MLRVYFCYCCHNVFVLSTSLPSLCFACLLFFSLFVCLVLQVDTFNTFWVFVRFKTAATTMTSYLKKDKKRILNDQYSYFSTISIGAFSYASVVAVSWYDWIELNVQNFGVDISHRIKIYVWNKNIRNYRSYFRYAT